MNSKKVMSEIVNAITHNWKKEYGKVCATRRMMLFFYEIDAGTIFTWPHADPVYKWLTEISIEGVTFVYVSKRRLFPANSPGVKEF